MGSLIDRDASLDGLDADPSRSPISLGWTNLGLLLVSLLCLVFGKKYPSLTGSPTVNVIGWVFGAILVPTCTIIYRQIELVRRTNNPGHISSRSLQQWMVSAMVIGVVFAGLHGFLFSLVRQ